MKMKMYMLAGLCICLIASISSFSQQKDPSVPAWVSEHGYWVVETNIHRPGWHRVRFYDNGHTLVGEQEMANAKLNIKRKKVKMKLKAMLESSLQLWAKQHPGNDSHHLAKKE